MGGAPVVAKRISKRIGDVYQARKINIRESNGIHE
jgi:hypothetical protein